MLQLILESYANEKVAYGAACDNYRSNLTVQSMFN